MMDINDRSNDLPLLGCTAHDHHVWQRTSHDMFAEPDNHGLPQTVISQYICGLCGETKRFQFTPLDISPINNPLDNTRSLG